MNVLGVSAFYHDASAAVLCDGAVLATATEERLSLIKHDRSYPRLAIAACLRQAGLAPADLDAVVLHEDQNLKFTRMLAAALAGFPRSLPMFTQGMQSWLGGQVWFRNRISKELGIHPGRVHCVRHHDSHAAQAFAASPFRDAAVLVVDAVGEWACTSLFHGRIAADGQLRLELLDELRYPNSLGLVYAAFTAFLGFRVNDGECSTMALAAFGSPRYVDTIRQIVRVQADGTHDVDGSYFDFARATGLPLRPRFLAAFGAPRDHRTPLPFDALAGADAAPASPVSADAQRFVDIAASLQIVLEEAMLALGRRAARRTGSPNLCLAGGVALNCVANGRLLAEGPFAEVFVPPDPGDGGASVGAALHGHHVGLGAAHRGWRIHPYLGLRFDSGNDLATFQRLRPASWRRFRAPGAAALADDLGLQFTTCDPAALLGPVVDDLRAGRIVGWFQGRFENGPRALGNRSLLIDPANVGAARRLSRTTKHRSSHRPYALAVSAEAAPRVFGPRPPSHLDRWMQTTARVLPELVPQVRAAMHVDGTTRPQVCGAADNPRFHALLAAYGQATGLAALLNTSFNLSGMPIVSTPVEAMLMLARTDIDTLVLDDTVIRKPGSARA